MAQEQQQPESPEIAAILNTSRDIDDAAETVLTGEAPQAAELVDPVKAWEMIPKMLRPLIVGSLPEVAPAWSDEAIRMWAESAQAAFPDTGGMPPMVAFCLSSVALALPVVGAIKVRKARAAAKPAESPQNAAEGIVSAPAH